MARPSSNPAAHSTKLSTSCRRVFVQGFRGFDVVRGVDGSKHYRNGDPFPLEERPDQPTRIRITSPGNRLRPAESKKAPWGESFLPKLRVACTKTNKKKKERKKRSKMQADRSTGRAPGCFLSRSVGHLRERLVILGVVVRVVPGPDVQGDACRTTVLHFLHSVQRKREHNRRGRSVKGGRQTNETKSALIMRRTGGENKRRGQGNRIPPSRLMNCPLKDGGSFSRDQTAKKHGTPDTQALYACYSTARRRAGPKKEG